MALRLNETCALCEQSPRQNTGPRGTSSAHPWFGLTSCSSCGLQDVPLTPEQKGCQPSGSRCRGDRVLSFLALGELPLPLFPSPFQTPGLVWDVSAAPGDQSCTSPVRVGAPPSRVPGAVAGRVPCTCRNLETPGAFRVSLEGSPQNGRSPSSASPSLRQHDRAASQCLLCMVPDSAAPEQTLAEDADKQLGTGFLSFLFPLQIEFVTGTKKGTTTNATATTTTTASTAVAGSRLPRLGEQRPRGSGPRFHLAVLLS